MNTDLLINKQYHQHMPFIIAKEHKRETKEWSTIKPNYPEIQYSTWNTSCRIRLLEKTDTHIYIHITFRTLASSLLHTLQLPKDFVLSVSLQHFYCILAYLCLFFLFFFCLVLFFFVTYFNSFFFNHHPTVSE